MKHVNPRLPYKTYDIFGHKTSKIEIVDLIKAWIAISIAFGIILTRIQGPGATMADMFLNLGISGFTVGTAFLLHEMGHKVTAQRYGLIAEFRSFDFMLLVAIAMALFLGIVIAAPGAVMIAGKVHKNKYGIISMAGPMVNIILALLFGVALAVTEMMVMWYGFLINGFIALFNMIPFGAFDGKKIMNWNKTVYGIMVAISFTMVFIAFQLKSF